MAAIGVDGCPDGWLAVAYTDDKFHKAAVFEDIWQLWDEYDDASTLLIDVPIGLREESAEPRPCDRAARAALESPRSSSVFPTPIRSALDADSYKEAKEIQEENTNGSLGAQTWGISSKICELDTFMREAKAERVGRIRESHPEVCFWAFNEETATEYSKTGQPIAAFWERVEILEKVDDNVIDDIRSAGLDLDSEASNDDLLDAFALSLTASSLTGEIDTLPLDHDMTKQDPKDLPMEMVFSRL